VVFALKYDMGVVLPKNRVKALILLNLSVIIAFAFTIISIILISIFKTNLTELLQIKESYSFVLYILPFSTLFFSLYNTFNYLLIRDKKFVSSSINRISRRGAEGAIQVGFGFSSNLKSFGLFIGDLIGNFVFFLSAFYQSIGKIKYDKRFFKPSMLKAVAKEYSDLPKYNIIPEMLNGFFGASITFMVLSKFGMEEVGYLEPTQRILAIPAAFISVSVGQVLLQRISESIGLKRKITKNIIQISLGLTAMIIPFYIIIKIFGPDLFAWFFGDKWKISGTYATFLVMYFSISFITSPLGQVLIALKKFKINALWQIGKFAVIYAMVIFSYNDIFAFLKTYDIIGSAVYVIYGLMVFYFAISYDKKIS
jgi:O-antigen/teichoic acid export membrane protein